jgi:hypothetical protein
MPTQNKRVNVTLDKDTAKVIASLAKKDPSHSISNVVKQLVMEALELREDMYLSKRSESREHEETIPYEKVKWD